MESLMISRWSRLRRWLAVTLAAALVAACLPGAALAADPQAAYVDVGFESEAELALMLTGRYSTGVSNSDGGVAEIVAYNPDNNRAYMVNGATQLLDIVDLSAERSTLTATAHINLATLAEAADTSFTYGDMTSVAVVTEAELIAVALQAADYQADGRVALLSYDGELEALLVVGKQPDMICATAAGDKLLVANEGEPRAGYGAGAVDPAGSVSVIDLNPTTPASSTVTDITFADFDSEKTELTAAGVLLGQKDGVVFDPSVDLEPEYIAASADGRFAYVALQEANAIATLDLSTNEFIAIESLGFKHVSLTENAIDLIEDGKYEPLIYPDVSAVYMPDGITIYQTANATYLLTANEGDAREWGSGDNEFSNEQKTTLTAYNMTEAEKVRTLDHSTCAGLTKGVEYLFGGRSFSIFEVTEQGELTMVYDSANDFEAKTAAYLEPWFNSSNDDNEPDSRSQKKGPEPESITIGMIDGRAYAFIALERIGGVMVYDVTDPTAVEYVNYINTRDFAEDPALANDTALSSDLSPEGLCFIPAAESATGENALLAACEVSGTLAAYAVIPQTDERIAVLYTNDVHCGIDRVTDETGQVTNIGYAGLASYLSRTEGIYGADRVTLTDAGDALQGEAIGTLSEGEYLTDIMNRVGYDVVVPGNHEFDYGMEQMKRLMSLHKASVVTANFISLETGEPVFDKYEIISYGDVDVAYIGISTPESFTKSTPVYFQNSEGEYIYSFCEGGNGAELYAAVQEAVEEARAEGADYVVAIGHTGIVPESSPWMSSEIIANTTGIDAYIDGHSHSTIARCSVANKDGELVPLTSSGTKLANIGKLVIDTATGEITTGLVNGYGEEDAEVKAYIGEIKFGYEDVLNEVVATSSVQLIVNDPTSGERLIRKMETNLGDFCADAYRIVLGADIGFVNGGGIRADIKTGDITYGDIISVHPFNNYACAVEASGQEILDALEMASVNSPEEDGGFLHVSGITYTIDTSIASTVVVDDKRNFVRVDGARRVKNVRVGGQPIDPNRTYTVGSHNYLLLDGGGGANMFMDNPIAVQPVMLDNQLLITYITDHLNGVIGDQYSNLLGEGRITIQNGTGSGGGSSSSGGGTSSSTAPEGVSVSITSSTDGVTVAQVTLPSGSRGELVEIPITGGGMGYVAALVADGRETVISGSIYADGKMLVPLTGDATLKIYDGSVDFTDIGAVSSWAGDGIDFASSHGLLTGTASGIFSPDLPLSRAMLVTALWRYVGEPAGGASSFTDLASGAWYTTAVGWGSGMGIVEGFEDGTFRPETALSREEMGTILFRMSGATAPARSALEGYADRDEISAWALDGMAWAVSSGIMQGSDGVLRPTAELTRAEAAVMLMRYVAALNS